MVSSIRSQISIMDIPGCNKILTQRKEGRTKKNENKWRKYLDELLRILACLAMDLRSTADVLVHVFAHHLHVPLLLACCAMGVPLEELIYGRGEQREEERYGTILTHSSTLGPHQQGTCHQGIATLQEP